MESSLRLRLSLNGKVGESVSLAPQLELISTPTIFRQVTSLDYPLFTGEGLIVSLLPVTPIVLGVFRESRTQ